MNIEMQSGEFFVGTIKFVDWNRGFGYIIPEQPGLDVRFSLSVFRPIVPGLEVPKFADALTSCCDLKAGDQVVFRQEPICRPGYRSTKKEAFVFGLREEFLDAEKKISQRPIFRVVQLSFYNGAPTSNPEREIAVGTLPKVKAILDGQFPEGAPINALFMTFNYRVFQRDERGNWVDFNTPWAFRELNLPAWECQVSQLGGASVGKSFTGLSAREVSLAVA